ncbi:MAG: 50S ribosomal protein L3 [Candidatus Omnitrophota bacterium]
MIKGILGKKIGMTQLFNNDGRALAVTVIEAGPCKILNIKTDEKDGYNAVQLGFENKKPSNVTKPLLGVFKKFNCEPLRYIREFSVEKTDEIKSADSVTVELFEVGEFVDISATTIGKGFQGGMKRWNWSGGPASHGSNCHRAPGSIGASSDPSRVYKGQHMPGQMGNIQQTTQGLEIVDVDKENNLLLVKGAVPGKKGNFLVINKSFKRAKRDFEAEKKVVHKKSLNPLKQSKKSMKK